MRCALLLAGVGACTVYDEGALGHKVSSTKERPSARDAASAPALETDAADGCEARRCVTRPTELSDSSVLDASVEEREPDASEDAATEQPSPDDAVVRADAGQKASESARRDAAAEPVDAGQVQSDAGAADAAVESGFCSACDSRPSLTPVLSESGGSGNVTVYGSVTSPRPSTSGACNYGATDIQYYAAINVDAQAGDGRGQWQGGRICGQCAAVRVKTPEGWKETTVRIVDKCGDANCGIAVSGAAARDLMGDTPGRYEGNWRFVSCEGHSEVSDGPPALHVKDGSSTWWALVHVRNPAWAVSAIDWRSSDGTSSGSFAFAREAENFFSVPEAVHSHGMVRLTIHYRDSSQVQVALAPGQLAQPASEFSLP